jgi:hypothetical protein
LYGCGRVRGHDKNAFGGSLRNGDKGRGTKKETGNYFSNRHTERIFIVCVVNIPPFLKIKSNGFGLIL